MKLERSSDFCAISLSISYSDPGVKLLWHSLLKRLAAVLNVFIYFKICLSMMNFKMFENDLITFPRIMNHISCLSKVNVVVFPTWHYTNTHLMLLFNGTWMHLWLKVLPKHKECIFYFNIYFTLISLVMNK